MKQRLLKALSLAAIAFCSVSTAWADRVAPTLPPAVEPQNEQCYRIYSPEKEKFISTTGYYASLTTQGGDITFIQSDEHWSLLSNSKNYFSCGFQELTWQASSNNKTFDFVKNNSSYFIQQVGKTTYVGYNDNSESIVQTTNAVSWQFMNAEKVAHYFAEKSLYEALEATDGRGWLRDHYEQMYNNRATCTNLELYQAAEELNNALNTSVISELIHSQNDYPIMIAYQGWNISGKALNKKISTGESAAITAMVETTENADLSYCVSYADGPVHVYVDEEEVRVINSVSAVYATPNTIWFDALKPGKHTIKWLFKNESTSSTVMYFYGIGVENTPLITVNCPLPGSLGTEILYNVDGLKDVRNLKVIGDLNADDMTRLTMLTGAHYIDLSEATCTADVPDNGFKGNKWLHSLILAEGINSIGQSAFYESQIEYISLPSSLKEIDTYAFYESNIKSLNMPNSVSELGSSAFYRCFNLRDITYSKSLSYVPSQAFEGCNNLMPFEIPMGVTTIKNSAFRGCNKYFIPTLPNTLKTIEKWAFWNCEAIKKLVIPDGVSTIGEGAFYRCRGLEDIILPMNYYTITKGNEILWDCSKLKKITLNSPTLVKHTSGSAEYRITNDEYRPNITLCVPDYLVNQYKLDPYWYNFGDIVGFSTDRIKDWTINADLLLDSHSRFAGDPNLTIANAALRIEGDAPMGITNFQTTTAFSNYYHNNNFSSLSQVRSGCENITIKGDYTHWMKFFGSRWAFVSLPFDCKVSDITDLTEGRLHAVRYYDGAERAATGTGSSWKKFASVDAIIPAGQGFIIQVDGSTSDYNWIQFKSQDNASKQYVFSKKEFSKHLDKNPSSVESNQGWNLVGNPYLCYYNIHNLNFTAPITVWDGYDRTYKAYSIIDDDYALRPNEAFFVQCPSALDAITFPVGGKQFDATILTQNASQRRAAATSSRKMLNLTLSNDEATDQTRIVINDEASLGYEAACDASKFMSMDNTVAQLYTLDDQGTQYAINERPYDDGFVQLGASFATDCTYTIALTRGDMGSVFLTDLETGMTTDLTLSEYTFHANAGTDNGRFLISFVGHTPTAIEALTGSEAAEYYTIDGRHMGNNRSALGKGVYVVRSGNRSAKILVD